MRFLFITILALVSVLRPHEASAQTDYKKLSSDVLALVNEHRLHNKLPPLAMSDIIVSIAATHSRNMANGSVDFGHDGFDDRVSMLTRKIKHAYAWGENVAYGARTAKEVVNMWLNSPDHRENIEGNFNLTGISIARGKDGYLYFTQIFCKAKP